MARGNAEEPEVIFVGDRSRAALSLAAREGRLVRIGPGIYSARALSDQAEVVRRNWRRILEHEMPDAIITDRCARAGSPLDGVLTVVSSRKRPLELPGLIIEPRAGSGPLPGDSQIGRVWVASPARGLLENLRSGHHRYLSRVELETWIADLLSVGGAGRLNSIRDQARELAERAGWQRECARLNAIIGAALSTQPVDALASGVLRAHSAGASFDHHRVELLERLAETLRDTPVQSLPLDPSDEGRRTLLPLYEAYFSNFIEGTEFTLDEAAAIVFDEEVPANRPADAHDILGTYRLVADPVERACVPHSSDDLIEILRWRHRLLMEARPDRRPGRFKERSNRAGETIFVAPAQVEETLRSGFDIAAPILSPFARGLFVGFLVSEVHPFDDGNGRISRVMMNAELSSAQEGRIIIPTVFRNNYLAALRAASRNGQFASLIETLRFAQRYTAKIDFSSRVVAETALAQTNALRDPDQAEESGIRLQMP